MNIKEQTDYVLRHPGFVEAVRLFAMGDTEYFRDVLYRLQLHCIDVQIKNSAKEYGLCKRMNGSDIKEALLSLRQPENLDVRLPIPVFVPPVEECMVIDLVPHKNKRAARFFNPLQLMFEFPSCYVSIAVTL